MTTENHKPRGWPANKPPADPGITAEQAASDAAAGFIVTADFERFSQRNDAFCRSWWDDAVKSDHARGFFDSYRMEASPRKGEGFTQKDFALRNAAWAVSDAYSTRNTESRGLREGFLDPLEPTMPVAPEKIEPPDPPRMAAEIKRIARLFGADLVGITAYDPRWVYEFRADAKTMEEKPNDLPDGLTSVIVLACAMDYSLVQTYPSALAGSAVGLGYSREAGLAAQLSQYICNLGYQAVGSLNDTALVIPYAIKAGLGEYGRNQMVITKEFGPRVRFSKIFTDLPLSHDAPKVIGVRKTCDICTRCADACPPKALPFGAPDDTVHNRSSIKGVVKWTADCEKCFGYWIRLKSDCAICLRVCPYNRDYKKLSSKLIRFLLGTSLRRLGLWFSDKIGHAGRVRPKDWWQGLIQK